MHTNISKTAAKDIIKKQLKENKIVIVTYTKKKGEERTITCRKSPLVGNPEAPELKAKRKNSAELGYELVYDVQKKDWRHINLQEVKAIETGKQSYIVN